MQAVGEDATSGATSKRKNAVCINSAVGSVVWGNFNSDKYANFIKRTLRPYPYF